MADYISAPIEADPEELVQLSFDHLRAVIPGWEPADGNLDVWLVEAFAQIAAQVTETASDVPAAIFRYFGTKLLNLAPHEASAATATTAWTLLDTDGHTIPEGTTILVDTPDGSVGFQTAIEWTVPAGSDTATAVPVTAVEPGAAGNGLTGTADLQDNLDFVVSVTFEAASAGGADAETDDDYLTRLSEELTLLTPRPIHADDFATMLRARIAGVHRAVALDGYNPADSTFGNERMVAVCGIDEAGQAIGATQKADGQALLEEERETNFVVNIIDPTYTAVDVTFTATAYPNFDAEDVRVAAEAAVQTFLSPATWGSPTSGNAGPEWVNEPKVRWSEVNAVLNNVVGLRYVETLSLNGGAIGVDVDLAGAVPLPQPGTISGSVT